ncbi:hypothetical protein ABN028_20155 [Actinopolymorpha sp. B17G11]|uniref:hypothetical protein n=1 Tax=Actinopolymorpha sp. B17G11 TaxID=3160861 RepID=UPI0032E392FD
MSRTRTLARPGWVLSAASAVIAGLLLSAISPVLAIAAGVLALVVIGVDVAQIVAGRWRR